MQSDPHLSLVSQLTRNTGIAVFSLREETQRGCDFLKDHVLGSGRAVPETGDCSLLFPEKARGARAQGALAGLGVSRSWLGSSGAGGIGLARKFVWVFP